MNGNVNIDHVVKQKKKKNLSNEYVYASHNGVVEMFRLKDVSIGNKPLGKIIDSFEKEINTINNRLENVKVVNKALLNKITKIEGKLKKYGLE